jgi:hypothetical protein
MKATLNCFCKNVRFEAVHKSTLLNENHAFDLPIRFSCKSLGAKVRRSNGYPLDLIERDLVARAIIEFGGARAFVRGHGLRIL